RQPREIRDNRPSLAPREASVALGSSRPLTFIARSQDKIVQLLDLRAPPLRGALRFSPGHCHLIQLSNCPCHVDTDSVLAKISASTAVSRTNSVASAKEKAPLSAGLIGLQIRLWLSARAAKRDQHQS